MANQEMERALIFAGYEVNHDWGTGGHSGEHATKVFPDAMRWLWKDWPQPVKAGRGSQQLQEILDPRRRLDAGRRGLSVHRGPGAQRSRRESSSTTSPTARPTRSAWTAKSACFSPTRNGPTARRSGRTAGSTPLPRAPARSWRTTRPGNRDGDRRGHPRQRPGRSSRRRDLRDQPWRQRQRPSTVWYISPQGEKRVVDKGLKFANGITLSPDQSLLYVADFASHWVYSYQVQPDGSLVHKQRYFHLHAPDTADDAGADGMRVDRDGRLYVATRMGIQVCDQAGRVNCIIPTPNGRVANLCFGGPDFQTLYATCGDRVYKRKVKVKGANAYEAPDQARDAPAVISLQERSTMMHAQPHCRHRSSRIL